MGNYSKFVDDIISIEPFKYLNYKNKFTFQVVDTFHLSSFLSLEYHSRGHQGAAVVQTSYLTKDAKKEIIDFSNEICGKTDLVIFIDGNYPQRYIIGQDGAIILLTESQPGYCSWQGNKSRNNERKRICCCSKNKRACGNINFRAVAEINSCRQGIFFKKNFLKN